MIASNLAKQCMKVSIIIKSIVLENFHKYSSISKKHYKLKKPLNHQFNIILLYFIAQSLNASLLSH